QSSLLELLNRLLDRGVLVWGDLRISVADVDLIEIGVKVMLVSVETAERWRGPGHARGAGAPADRVGRGGRRTGPLAVARPEGGVRGGPVGAAIRGGPPRSALAGRAGHHAAVVAWCRIAALLPAPAGIPVTDDLIARIARDNTRHLAQLAQVAGCIEIVVE